MLLALAFVPEADVLTSFAELHCECPAKLHGVHDEFKEFFITGKSAEGRHLATRPIHAISLWNQCETVINELHSTNNELEG